MLIFDTIVALSTPPYKSALALVRLSGPKATEVLQSVIKRDVNRLVPNRSFFTILYSDKERGEKIDEAVVTLYKGPKSYTGFDSVDFSVHGSMFVVDELIDTLVKNGARRAEPGEFSAQAYHNGKMDLLKAESINDLINATSSRGKAIALSSMSGRSGEDLDALKMRLLDVISELEYYVEDQYSEEKDDYDVELNRADSSIKEEIAYLSKLIDDTHEANREYRGIEVVIAGEPNAGKSTLLNALVGSDRAIVSPVAGTTRDVIEVEKEIRGIRFIFKDTAGLRKTDDLVENLGIERSYRSMKEADIVLLVSDSGFKEVEDDAELESLLSDKPVIRIASKKDLGVDNTNCDIALSAINDDLSDLIDLIFDRLDLVSKSDAEFSGERAEDYLKNIKTSLEEASKAIEETRMIDIASDDIRRSIDLINEMAGNHSGQTMEDIYETLFSKFCLGK